MNKNIKDNFAVIGLGNPGRKYMPTRHNCGQISVNKFIKNNDQTYKKWKNILLADFILNSQKVFCMQSREFLNVSGHSYYQLIKEKKITNKNIIVIADDIDIDVGRLSIQYSKSSGGNNGMKSLLSYLPPEPIIKIRIGIGRPIINDTPSYDQKIVSDWVLGKPDPQELMILKETMEQAALAIERIINYNIEEAMNQFNKIIPE
jgi:PTH1 family peptidyl-tRNA hydrolase